MFDKKKPADKGQDAIKPGNPAIEEHDQAVIHSMPKRYLHVVKKTSGGHKKTGLLILSLGAALLVAAFGVAYYYLSVSKPAPAEDNVPLDEMLDQPIIPVSPPPPQESNNNPTVSQPLNSGTEDAPTDGKETTDVNGDKPRIDSAPDLIIASGTAETASSSMAEDAPAEATSTPAKTFIPASDADQDGLSDLEEILLSTNMNEADSDNDGYSDSSELMNLYNPAGSGTIITNPGINKYSNSTYQYSLYYPSSWPVSAAGGDDSIIFKPDNSQFVQVIVSDEGGNTDIEDWYKEQFNAPFIRPEQIIYKAGWSGVMSDDGLIAYLKKPGGDKIYTVSYNAGLTSVIGYKSIFNMMIKSLTAS